jgi:hypothetical protein
MLNSKKILFWMSTIILIVGTQSVIKAQVVARLVNQYNTKVCGTEKNKEFLITFGLGQVKKEDSLFAFDIIVEYDPNKVILEGAVYQNTLSEFLKYRDVNTGYESNRVRMFAFSDQRLSGNLELIGFWGRIKDDCDEPIEFKIIDLDLTEDYKAEYSIDSTLTIIPERIYDSKKFIELNLDSDSLVFDEESVFNTKLSIEISPYTFIEEMFFDIVLNNDVSFDLIDVQSLDELVTIESFEKITSTIYELHLRLWGDINEKKILNFAISELMKNDLDVISQINIIPRDFGNCNCYSRFDGDSLQLISKAKEIDTTVSVHTSDVLNLNITQKGYIVEIENQSDDMIKSIVLVDVLGKVVYYSYEDSDEYNVIINTLNYQNGYYNLRIITNKNEVNKSIIIYN